MGALRTCAQLCTGLRPEPAAERIVDGSPRRRRPVAEALAQRSRIGCWRARARLAQLRLALGGLVGYGRLGPPLCVLFEGWDAGGKGGAIKRLVAPLDARHVRVKQFAAPTTDEKRHHYLHRFVSALPGWGGMAVLDRTWYGRVLVERVEGFATEDEWRRAYDEIDEFEDMLADDGMIIVKFWLHISDGEQLKRFERRREDPLKAWKLTDEDWRNRAKRQAYEAAVEEMVERTDTTRAVADGPGRLQAVRARARDAGGHRRDRGRAARGTTSRCPSRWRRSTD